MGSRADGDRKLRGPDRGRDRNWARGWGSGRGWRQARTKRSWGLQRRLTTTFVFVALAAVALTSWLTLGASFRAQRELTRLILENQAGGLERNGQDRGGPLEPSGPILRLPDGTLIQPFEPRFEWLSPPRLDDFEGPRFARAQKAMRNLTSRSLLAAVIAFALASASRPVSAAFVCPRVRVRTRSAR
jgi:hypothetical protein